MSVERYEFRKLRELLARMNRLARQREVTIRQVQNLERAMNDLNVEARAVAREQR